MDNLGLLQKQERLLEKSARLRLALNHQLQQIKNPLSYADQCISVVAWLYQHPIYPAIATGILLMKRPSWVFTSLRTLFIGWLTRQRMRR